MPPFDTGLLHTELEIEKTLFGVVNGTKPFEETPMPDEAEEDEVEELELPATLATTEPLTPTFTPIHQLVSQQAEQNPDHVATSYGSRLFTTRY